MFILILLRSYFTPANIIQIIKNVLLNDEVSFDTISDRYIRYM